MAQPPFLKSENEYRNIVESCNDGICIIQDNSIKFVNRRMARMLGVSKEDILGTSFFSYVHPDELSKVAAFYEGLGSDDKKNQRLETIISVRNGALLNVDVSIAPTFHNEELAVLVMLRDMTGLKQIEKEKESLERILHRTQRMEAIGTLAGGIAHEFNNILWIISANAEYALEILPDESKVHKNLKRIESACTRATDLVGQILSFSRRHRQSPKPLDIRAIVKETLKFMRASFPKSIEIQTEIAGDLGLVMADPTKLHQVVTNLCTNALHAMRETGGVLEVSLKNIDSGDTVSFPLGMAPGRYVNLTVRDAGVGMAPEVAKRVFEPFFTTKQIGQGSGLGLSVVYGIIESCNGAITVKSDPGKGSVFEVFLPIIEESSHRKAVQRQPLPTGEERILFIDDEVEIANSAKEILGGLGYQVAVETNPLRALERFKQSPHEFALVITDMSMPHMNGEVLAGELNKIRSDVPIIICTGYGEMIHEDRAEDVGVRELLMKPASIGTVAEAIRRVLDRP